MASGFNGAPAESRTPAPAPREVFRRSQSPVLAAGLLAVARFASAGVATFVLSLLAVQCVLNALLDLKTVFFLSSPFAPSVPTDAANMAAATGIPAVLWTIIWIAIAFGILMVALRFYVAARDRAFDAKKDLPIKQNVGV